MTFTVETGPPYETPVAPRPKGDVRATATVASTAAWTEIVSYTPTKGKTFALAKILATFTGTDEQEIRVKLDTEVVAHYHATGYVMDWFPPGVEVEGDGTKTVVIEAKGTVNPDITGFIVGEES
jgi:hypothetical protein